MWVVNWQKNDVPAMSRRENMGKNLFLFERFLSFRAPNRVHMNNLMLMIYGKNGEKGPNILKGQYICQ